MQNEYIPEVGTKTVPMEPQTVTGILNPLTPGTRLRVTMPGTETVIVGEVAERVSAYAIIELKIDGQGFGTFREVSLWVESGWKFEVLPALVSERELVNA